MRVLMLGGDKQVLEPGTQTARRFEVQRTHTNRLDVFVWPQLHSLKQIFTAAGSRAYDVVTAQDTFWRGLVAWVMARTHGMRLHLQVHADLEAQWWYKRLIAHFLLRRAHSVRVVSERVAEQVRRTGTKAAVHVLPIYVDLERFTHLVPIAHERPTILWIGRFEKEKDPLRAIALLRAVRARGTDAVLVMLGAGSLDTRLRAAARGLPVEFPGWKPPEEYLPYADMVLSTSPAESWGASIIEALAAGVPVVSYDVGVAREAGAIITDRAHDAATVMRVLNDKPRGILRITFMDRAAWAARWRETLL